MRTASRILMGMCLMAGTCVNRAGASEWTFDASAFVFDPRRDNAFVSPVLSAGRGTLHLEARWNYEDLDTGSLFLGHTFEFGGSVSGSVAPMIGVVAGATDGLAPGLELEIGWRRFLFSSESEVILDAHDADDNFLFTWLEGTVEAGRGVSLGFAAQRTKAFETGLDLQRGPMLAYAAERGWLGLYWFNPDRSDDQMLVLGGGWTF